MNIKLYNGKAVIPTSMLQIVAYCRRSSRMKKGLETLVQELLITFDHLKIFYRNLFLDSINVNYVIYLVANIYRECEINI